MANYLTRVELHNASADDYAALHKNMAAKGFSRTIAIGGKTWSLPTAEYFSTSSESASKVAEKARQAADATGRSNWVITAQYVDISGYLVETK